MRILINLDKEIRRYVFNFLLRTISNDNVDIVTNLHKLLQFRCVTSVSRNFYRTVTRHFSATS